MSDDRRSLGVTAAGKPDDAAAGAAAGIDPASAAAKASMLQANWLSKLSHDLRNQLSPMRTATQLLQSGRLDSERQAEMLDTIERQIQRMVKMLDDVAEFGRVGSAGAKREPVHLDYVIDSALGECGKRMTAAGHAFDHQMPDQRVRLHGDRARLVQMFVRLLDNAIRFTPTGGRIALHVVVGETHADVSLRDSGPGIQADRLDRIFELPDGPRAAEGLGISLLLARACAREHGGDLHARSDGEGRGSEFTVRLPLVAG